eukprot:GHVU01033274.1.p1 GENE.GHVU01033274.1~~GHVU01033274.1.p1  ORF type:complete len:151 (+),score=13.50 GHVU01033274.1:541-993(+)
MPVTVVIPKRKNPPRAARSKASSSTRSNGTGSAAASAAGAAAALTQKDVRQVLRLAAEPEDEEGEEEISIAPPARRRITRGWTTARGPEPSPPMTPPRSSSTEGPTVQGQFIRNVFYVPTTYQYNVPLWHYFFLLSIGEMISRTPLGLAG